MEGLQLLKQKNIGEDVKRLYAEQGPLCDSEGFYQHEGECWNDSLQMIFLYTDGIKEIVQKRLAEAPIEPEEVDTVFRPYVSSQLNSLLKRIAEKRQSNNNTNNNDVTIDEESSVQLGLLYISLAYEYLTTVQKRFYRHYIAESSRLTRFRQDTVCSTEDKKGEKILEDLKRISLALRAKGREGVSSGLFGQELKLENLTKRRNPQRMSEVYEPGGGKESRNNVINIFTHFFLLPIQVTSFMSLLQIYGDRFQNPTTKELLKITSNTNALYCGINIEGDGHAVSFYKCGGREFYYDDNTGSIQFPWITFFKHLQEPISTDFIDARKQWIRAMKYKYPVFDNELMDYKVYFDGELRIMNEKNKLLHKCTTYPYLMRFLYKEGNVEIKTYVWNTTPIVFSSLDSSFPFEYKTQIQSNTGEMVTAHLTIEKKTRKYFLQSIQRFDYEGNGINSAAASKTGSFLGARIRHVNSTVDQLMFEDQIQKVKEGKAKIDDVYSENLTPLLFAILSQDIKLIQEVLDLGANIHKKTEQESPLFFAMTYGGEGVDEELLQFLLENGADKDLNDPSNLSRGITPLIGCFILNDHETMLQDVRGLLENGANVNQPSKENVLPIQYAEFFNVPNEVIDFLIEKGAPKPVCFSKEILLKRVGSDSLVMHWIRQNNPVKATLIARCCRELELFDDLNHENLVGDTALKLAMNLKQDNWSDKLIDELIKHGANVNYVDRLGFTPLYYAISLGKLPIVKKLFEWNANPNLTVEGLGSPLEYAQRLGHTAIVEFLEEELQRQRYKNTRRYKPQRVTRRSQKPSKLNLRFKKRTTKRAINKAKASNLITTK